MSHPVYIEKQWMKLLLIILPVVTLLSLSAQLLAGVHMKPGVWLVLSIVTIFVLVFVSSMTTTVDEAYLRWSFGFFGLLAWKLALSEIASIEATTVTIWDGRGIKLTTQGMLYNADGSGAIRVTKKNGKSFRLGTQDPQRLISYLAPRIGTKIV